MLTTTTNRTGSGQHISISGQSVLSAFHPRPELQRQMPADSLMFRDIGLDNGILLVLTNKGLFTLNLKEEVSLSALHPYSIPVKKPELLLKTPNGDWIAVAKEGYALVNEPEP